MTQPTPEVTRARIAVLDELASRQAEGTSPITVQIGNITDRMVRHDTLLIRQAPPVVFTKIASLVDDYKGLSATITDEGLLLHFWNPGS